MDPSACRVIYIDERFNTERWISRQGLGSTHASEYRRKQSSPDFDELPTDLQANVNAFLSVFNQGRRLYFHMRRRILTILQFTYVALADHFRPNWQKSTTQSRQIVHPYLPASMLDRRERTMPTRNRVHASSQILNLHCLHPLC